MAVFDFPDSGEVSDLDSVKVSEKVPAALVVGTGLYAGETGEKPIDWQPAHFPDGLIDKNGRNQGPLPRGRATRAQFVADLQGKFIKRGNGGLTVLQSFIFSEARTGVPANADGTGAMIVKKSGFQIEQKNEITNTGKYELYVTRTAVANQGADAGTVVDATKKTAEVK